MDDADLNDETMHFEKLRGQKQVIDPKTKLAEIFTLHQSQIVQAEMEEGAAREQKKQYVHHIAERQKAEAFVLKQARLSKEEAEAAAKKKKEREGGKGG